MAKKGTWGINTYRDRSKKKIGRHTKNMNKSRSVASSLTLVREDNFLPLKNKEAERRRCEYSVTFISHYL